MSVSPSQFNEPERAPFVSPPSVRANAYIVWPMVWQNGYEQDYGNLEAIQVGEVPQSTLRLLPRPVLLDLNNPATILLFCAHLAEQVGHQLLSSPNRAECAEAAEWLSEVAQSLEKLTQEPRLRMV